MTPAEFNKLYEIETLIRSYEVDFNMLLNFYTDNYVEVHLILRHDIDHEDFETPRSEFKIAGSGITMPDHKNYSPNARIIQAGVKAMIKEVDKIQNEAKAFRNKALRKTLES